MATAETARLIASLELQDKNFTRGIGRVEKGVDRVDRKLGAFSGFVNRNLGRAVDSLALRLVGAVSTGLEEMATLENAATSVAGAISQVGPKWKTTADDIVTAANRIESETDAAFDDKAIVAASETLIRYGKVSEQNLVPAMEVMADLAARTGDVDSAATLLAKALADPSKAAGKLARQGIILTKQQQKQIKAMVKAGDVAGAQALLLEELEKTTKGAAAASAGPYRDALNKLGDAGEDLRRGFVTGLAPAILEVSDLLTDELAKPGTMQALKDVGKEVGAALKGLIGIAKGLPWDSIGASLKLAGAGAKAVLDAFLGLPPWVQTAVLTGWGLNKLTGGALSGVFTSFASGLIKGVLGMNAGVVNINAGVVNGGGVPGVPGKGGGGLLGTAAKFIVPVTIASVTVGAAKVLTDAIDPGFQRGLEEGRVPLANRDPRRFDKFGRVVEQWDDSIDRQETVVKEVHRGAPGAFRPDWSKLIPKIQTRAGRTTAAREGSTATHVAIKDAAKKAQATTNAVKNAASIASRENSAQKAELGNIENNLSTMDANQRAAAVAAAANATLQGALQAGRDALERVATRGAGNVAANASRGAGSTVAAAIHAEGAMTRATIRASRPIIQPTNVIEKYTTVVRGGATSDSRSGPLR